MKKLYEYDGELLVLSEILAKPECVVIASVLSGRLRLGMEPKKAATTPAIPRRSKEKKKIYDTDPMTLTPCYFCPVKKCNMFCSYFNRYTAIASDRARLELLNEFKKSLLKSSVLVGV